MSKSFRYDPDEDRQEFNQSKRRAKKERKFEKRGRDRREFNDREDEDDR